MSHYVATAAALVGLPVFLLKQSMRNAEDDTDAPLPSTTRNWRSSPSLLPICKEGLLTRFFVTGVTVAGVISLFYLKYPSINNNNINLSENEKSAIMGIRFISSMIIQNWKWKMFEMTMSGKYFFIKHNIKYSWQAILTSIIEPSRIDFNSNNSMNTKHNDKNTSTRKDAFFHFLELTGYAAVLYSIHTQIISNNSIDIDNLSCWSKVGLMMSLSLPVIIMNNLPSILIGLVFGDIKGININIRYCYSYPLLSINLKQFWKRWSIQIGEPLANYFYLPIVNAMGSARGNYPIIASFVPFLVNGLDHIFYGGMLSGDGNYPWKTQGSAFVILWIGTVIDGLIDSYFIRKRKISKHNIVIKIARYAIMCGTLVGQTLCLWDNLLPMIQNKPKSTQQTYA